MKCLKFLLICLTALPACRTTAAEPISYRLTRRDGRVVIQSSTGKILPWLCYGASSEREMAPWCAKNRPFIQSGTHLFQVALWPGDGSYWKNQFWSNDGKSVTTPRQPVTLNEQVTWLLEQDPDAHFIIRFPMRPNTQWRKRHRDQYVPLPDDVEHPLHDRLSVMPSMASEVWLKGIEQLIHDVLAWCEKQPWRNRVIGYSLFPFGEGTTEIAIHGKLFDRSPVMQKRFKADVAAKYKTDAALQAAWQDKTVTLDAVTVPTFEDWEQRRRRREILHWPDPEKVQRERDYFACHKKITHAFWTRVFDAMAANTKDRPVIKGYDILKQPMLGWMHNRDFDAKWTPGQFDSYGAAQLASGSIGVAPLLDHPGLDILQTPGMYYNRAMGYAFEPEGLTDSLTLRGKANFMEADLRSWINRDWEGAPIPKGALIKDAGVFMTPEEMRAGFDRALGWALTRNQMYYFMSVCGANWWYDAPVIQKTIQRQRQVIELAARKLPWQNTEHAICLVIDDESPMYEDFTAGFQQIALEHQLEEGLALSGVPYRIHLLSDLKLENFPEYRCYLFPNLFKIDADVEQLLRKKVLRNGNVAIFGPGTGITDGRRRTAAPASRLLGVPMELVNKSSARRVMLQDHGHPISDRLPQTTYGSTFAFGPLLVPKTQRLPDTAKQAKALGAGFYFYFFDRPGLFINDFGRGARGSVDAERGADDYAVVFSPAIPMPAELLRECARYAGCNVWSEQNAVIHASRNLVSLHTVRSGPHTIQLPRTTEVWDLLTMKQLDEQTNKIKIDIKSPATRLFFLGKLPEPDVNRE